jgi:hypothetical protein
MSGYSPEGFWCIVDGHSEDAQELNRGGLTPRAATLLRSVTKTFGGLPTGGFQPGGVSDGHMDGSAHYEGRAIDFFFRPISADRRREGWVLAQYLVANANALKVNTVIFDDRIWTAGSRSGDGWRDYSPPGVDDTTPRETVEVLEHRDHVHVDVA